MAPTGIRQMGATLTAMLLLAVPAPAHGEGGGSGDAARPPALQLVKAAAAKKMAPPAPAAAKAAAPARTPHWSYEGDTGPAAWGTLGPENAACATGTRQSPIDIRLAGVARALPLRMHYKVTLIDLVNNGHTVQANYGKGSYITVGAERYDLVQFHFHTPGEHTVAGRSFPMEIHFVHRNAAGRLVMVGVLVAAGKENLAAREIWGHLPAAAHTKSTAQQSLINARDLLPEDTRYFRYAGSLTTPPCSESVDWFVLQTPVRFSAAQIARLGEIMGRNARPVQQRHGRYLVQALGE